MRNRVIEIKIESERESEGGREAELRPIQKDGDIGDKREGRIE